MSETDEAIEAQRQLHALDAEIETTRRRLWAVEHGLEKVQDAAGEAERLRARLTELGDEFLHAYQEWQAHEGRPDPGPTGE